MVALKAVESSDGGVGYTPVFSYTTHAGGSYSYSPDYTTKPAAWEVGETAPIAYDPAEPQHAQVLTYFGVFSRTMFLAAAGMPFVVVGVGYLLFRRYVQK